MDFVYHVQILLRFSNNFQTGNMKKHQGRLEKFNIIRKVLEVMDIVYSESITIMLMCISNKII